MHSLSFPPCGRDSSKDVSVRDKPGRGAGGRQHSLALQVPRETPLASLTHCVDPREPHTAKYS